MSESNSYIDCRYCNQRHRARYLCDPVKRIVDAMLEQGMRLDMPTIEFPDPVPGGLNLGGLQPGDQLMRQVVVQAGVMEVDQLNTVYPVIVFTGQNADGKPLPRWTFAGSDGELLRVRQLVSDTTDMAIRRAAQARRGRG